MERSCSESSTNACMDARNCTWQIGIAAAQGSEPKHLKRSICKRQGQPLYFFFATSQWPAEFSHLPCAVLGRGTKPWQSPEMLNEEKQNGVAASSQSQGAKQGGNKMRDCEQSLSVQLTLKCGAWQGARVCWLPLGTASLLPRGRRARGGTEQLAHCGAAPSSSTQEFACVCSTLHKV